MLTLSAEEPLTLSSRDKVFFLQECHLLLGEVCRFCATRMEVKKNFQLYAIGQLYAITQKKFIIESMV